MRILLVTGIFPPDHGGPASYVPEIARGFRSAGHDVVAVITLSDKLGHDDSRFDFPVVRIERHRHRLVRWFQTVRAISRLANRADVVYLNGLVLEGVVAAKLIGDHPTVIKVVGDLIWERARNQRATELDLDTFQNAVLPLRWRLLRRLQGWYSGCADAVITPSQYLANIVARWGVDSSRIKVIYNAIEIPQEGMRSQPQVDVVTVARLVPWKGLADLIEVVADQGWSLKIVGDGPMREELERLANHLRARVNFLGQVPKEQVAEVIRNGRLFVLFSSYEGLPHIVLEAKAVGVAVVASAAGGTPEVIDHGENGWLVPVGNRVELSAAIAHLLGNEVLRENLAAQGRLSLSGRFSYERMVKDTLSVLLDVAS